MKGKAVWRAVPFLSAMEMKDLLLFFVTQVFIFNKRLHGRFYLFFILLLYVKIMPGNFWGSFLISNYLNDIKIYTISLFIKKSLSCRKLLPSWVSGFWWTHQVMV